MPAFVRLKSLLLILALALCMAPSAALAAAADSGPQAIFILDASGSMWGKAGDSRKIDAAKQVLHQVIPSMPAEARLGLVAYGHRRSGDCQDVEILAMPAAGGRDALLAAVDAIKPKGKTPMANSLLLVADKLGKADAATTIVLVSDGLETCNDDPCAVVRSLKQKGIKFVLHVVGFGVDADGKKQLSCMAEAGGGRYFAAGDGAALLAALEEVKKEVAQQVEQAKTTKKAASTGLGKLHITVPEQAVKSLASIDIYRKGSDKPLKTAAPAADATHPLPAGEYRVVLSYANSNYAPPSPCEAGDYTVQGGATTELALGAIVPNVAQGLNEAVQEVRITRAGQSETLVSTKYTGNDYYLFKPKPLPAGKYDFYVVNAQSPKAVRLASGLEVAAGQLKVLGLSSGVVLKKPEDSGNIVGWNLTAPGSKETVLEVRRRSDNDYPLWKAFLVPPGSYDLYVVMRDMTEPLPVAADLVVEDGNTVEFDTGL